MKQHSIELQQVAPLKDGKDDSQTNSNMDKIDVNSDKVQGVA